MSGLGGMVVLWGHPHIAFPLSLVAMFWCEVRVSKLGGSRRLYLRATGACLCSRISSALNSITDVFL